MKVVKIRFIKHKNYYQIQKRLFFVWLVIGRNKSGFGDSIFDTYCNEDKDILLSEVIEYYFKTTKTNLIIIEHPMIIIY